MRKAGLRSDQIAEAIRGWETKQRQMPTPPKSERESSTSQAVDDSPGKRNRYGARYLCMSPSIFPQPGSIALSTPPRHAHSLTYIASAPAGQDSRYADIPEIKFAKPAQDPFPRSTQTRTVDTSQKGPTDEGRMVHGDSSRQHVLAAHLAREDQGLYARPASR